MSIPTPPYVGGEEIGKCEEEPRPPKSWMHERVRRAAAGGWGWLRAASLDLGLPVLRREHCREPALRDEPDLEYPQLPRR